MTGEQNNFATTFQNIILMQAPIFLLLFGLNVLHHHLAPQMHVSYFVPTARHSALPNVFVQVTAQEKTHNKTYTKTQGDNTRRYKNKQPSKKVSKTGRYMTNMSSRIQFVTSVSYISTKHRLSFPYHFHFRCHFCMCSFHGTKDNTHYACETRCCVRTQPRDLRSDCNILKLI